MKEREGRSREGAENGMVKGGEAKVESGKEAVTKREKLRRGGSKDGRTKHAFQNTLGGGGGGQVAPIGEAPHL